MRQCNYGAESIHIGTEAGNRNFYFNRSEKNIAIGRQAGCNLQGTESVAIGRQAGWLNQNSYSVAIGSVSGYIGQKSFCTSVGPTCGFSNQGFNSVGVGNFCGYLDQSPNSVAVGSSAGTISQGTFSVAIGSSAGENQAGQNTVSIGQQAGYSKQAENSIAIGYLAGSYSQRSESLAIGYYAGTTAQGSRSIKIGWSGAPHTQLSNCVSIGFDSGLNTQLQNTICIGPNVETFTQNSCYIRPIRDDPGAAPPGILSYNSTTGEIFQDTGKTFVIDHPNDKNKYLVHACVEGPEVGIFYKGVEDFAKVENKNSMYIFLPSYAKKIGKNFSIFVNPVGEKSKAIASKLIDGEKFKVVGNGKFNWIIYGCLQVSFSDTIENKDKINIKGKGPYTYIVKNN